MITIDIKKFKKHFPRVLTVDPKLKYLNDVYDVINFTVSDLRESHGWTDSKIKTLFDDIIHDCMNKDS